MRPRRQLPAVRAAVLGSVLILAALWTVGVVQASPHVVSHFAVNMGTRRVDLWGPQKTTTRTTRRSCRANQDFGGVLLVSTCSTRSSQPRKIIERPSHLPPKVTRGGASVAAVRTMTARQMEAFNLFSGGLAGTVAACLTNPLEVIKTQLQSSSTAAGDLITGRGNPVAIAKRILADDGPSGFFRGLPPTLVGIIPSRSAYFYAYQRSKKALGPYLPEGSPPNALISGLLAGILGNTLTNPIWMVRTRMQLHVDAAAGQRAYAGYGECIARIFKEEGIGGFYKGILASYWGCTEGALQFILYEQFKTKLLARENRRLAANGLPPTDELSQMSYFFSAAAAKMVASIATYPHEVARTRMREQARAGVFKYRGMWQTLGIIAREEGRQGLYSGMGVHLLKVVPNSAFMFLTYEVVRKWLGSFDIVEP